MPDRRVVRPFFFSFPLCSAETVVAKVPSRPTGSSTNANRSPKGVDGWRGETQGAENKRASPLGRGDFSRD